MKGSPDRLGLVAGYGEFPLELIHAFKAAGLSVHAVAVHEETSQQIEDLADSVCWLHVGQVGGMIRAFKEAGVTQVVMAGKVRKLHLFRNFRPDLTAITALLKLKDRRDDTIMLAVVDLLAREGITVVPQTRYAQSMLAGSGHLFGPKPDKGMLQDADFGFTQAKGIAALDIGQTVAVRDQAVLAVEAIEGTDAAIRRGGELGGDKVTIVKVAKPDQDQRFDVPVIGPDTLETMAAAGCHCLAIEAGQTLLLQQQRLAELARQHGIAVIGIHAPATAS
ncbi:MAG TPA: UDP-2,3-diacylglucosamine diphosphatase LpxI [Mariprofundaceae bacterium]|nr:UDP-2,3-diacylglucosamine diphosphatase LpxI [Mariprofundaceae bacterium]